jgi:hypothetical protein
MARRIEVGVFFDAFTTGECEVTKNDDVHTRVGAMGRVTHSPTASSNEPESTTVSIEKFGRDHWSTFAYIETLCIDNGGRPDNRRMRCDVKRHPQYGHDVAALMPGRYPTRLRGGEERDDHDDWDCADDLEAAGLIKIHGTGIFLFFEMTDRGWQIAAALRAHRATKKTSGATYDTFEPTQTADAVGLSVDDSTDSLRA